MIQREIFFKGWNRIVNRMSDPVTLETMYKIKDIQWQNLIWLQYTGINDISGIAIFEGDIVEKKTYPTRQIVVEFKNGKYNISDYVISKLKVIGNIYEHPHLLKQ